MGSVSSLRTRSLLLAVAARRARLVLELDALLVVRALRVRAQKARPGAEAKTMNLPSADTKEKVEGDGLDIDVSNRAYRTAMASCT